MSSDEPLGLHNLPPEILIRIFVELNFRERIQLERVCSTWRKLALAWAWRETRILKATDEYRNYKSTRPSRSLGRLSALLRRYGPNLEELHVGWGISVDTRFGRYFRHLAEHGKLAHVRIEEPLDVWHLDQIREHLSPMLVSLSIRLNKSRKRTAKQKKAALANLLANCPKLECLQLGDFDDLFLSVDPNRGQFHDPILPATVKYLHFSNFQFGMARSDEIPRLLLDNFPALQFFPLFLPRQLGEFDENHTFRWPIYLLLNYDTLQIHSPHFQQIRALQIVFYLNPTEIAHLANCCPQLDHLDLRFHWDGGWYELAPIRDLEALYRFKHLSSLALTIELRHFGNFDQLECTTGELAEPVLLEILTKLNGINALRSLHFKAYYENSCHYPDFSDQYLLQLFEKLPHLETFASALSNRNWLIRADYKLCPRPERAHICHHTKSTEYIQQFCDSLKTLLNGQREEFRGRQKSFKFTITRDHSYPESNLFVKWLPISGRIEWKNVPRKCTIPDAYDNYKYYPARSVVLDEMFEKKMVGQRIRRFFFDDIYD